MTDLFEHAGLLVVPILGLGALALFLAIVHATTSSTRSLVLAAGTTLTTVLIGLMGTVIGLQVSLRHLSTLPADKHWRVGIGALESINDLVLSIVFALVVTAILTLAAALRSPSARRAFPGAPSRSQVQSSSGS